ncbi:MAG: TolC family protein [Nitrospirae bacterium]|nr:TolC family protein [Nitrospirota bacterium]
MNVRALSLVLLLVLAVTPATRAAQSITLQNAYDAALASYETVRISQENTVQADSKVDQAWTYLYPKVTGLGSYLRYNETLPPNGGAVIFQPLGQLQAAVVLTQPLYTGGRALAALRAAKTMQESSRDDLSSTKQSLLLSVSEAYYAVIRSQRVVEVSRGALERMERHKKVTEREASTRRSKANVSALLRANTLVDQSRIFLVTAESNLKTARQRLSLLTQLPEDAAVVDPPVVQAPPEPVRTLQEKALKDRDDYISSQLGQKVAKENVAITAGAHYPQIHAEGGIRYTDSNPTTLMDATTYYGGVVLQVPIFEGGLMKAEVAEARSKQRQSELSTELLKRNIQNEVAEAYLNYQTLSTVLETAKTQFENARKNFDTVESLFSEGLLTSLSLIDAQQALFLAERELVAASIEQQLTILRLQRSIGALGKQTKS